MLSTIREMLVLKIKLVLFTLHPKRESKHSWTTELKPQIVMAVRRVNDTEKMSAEVLS